MLQGQLAADTCPDGHLSARQRAEYAEAGRALLDGCIGHLDDDARAAFWSAVRRCYNRPYNDAPPARSAAAAVAPEPICAGPPARIGLDPRAEANL
ncbi:hypothetical protein [Methylobacterium sp. ID0610]|uniref:hypothetical protein n=1 Tax=Methylobacterium carpenticola TaxID=3344827 RepID=UPI0036BD1E00